MAVTTSVVDVNNGNTGWTRQDVLDALETVFYQLGMNGSSTYAGVCPAYTCAPGVSYPVVDKNEASRVPYNDVTWHGAGGPVPKHLSQVNRFFMVKADAGSSSYYMMEYWRALQVDTTADTITVSHNATDANSNHARLDYLKDGDKLRWAEGESDASDSQNIPGLTPNTDYYVKRITSTDRYTVIDAEEYSAYVKIQLCTDPNDLAGSVVDLTSGWGGSATGNWRLQRPEEAAQLNATIYTYQGEKLYFYPDSTGFYIVDGDEYTDDRVLEDGNQRGLSYQVFPTGQGTTSVIWEVEGWAQTEDEVYDPTKISGIGYTGIQSYSYANNVTASMKGVIKVLPSWDSNNTLFNPYWKYTVPADGGRSELKLRVHRGGDHQSSTYEGRVSGVSIHSLGSGWSDNEVFVIPGEEIGGVATTNDINFGVNADESSAAAGDGTANIMTTNIGQGTTLFQKSQEGKYAVVKLVNDSSKKFGTTYWGIGLYDNNYRLCLSSGCGWTWLNRHGVNYTGSSDSYIGHFQGDHGMDLSYYYGYINRSETTGYHYMDFASSSTPQSYPLAIRTYRAPSQQDDNFAVIQFTQTINSKVYTYATFALHAGPNYGTNVFDMDHVWVGSYSHWQSDSHPFGNNAYRRIWCDYVTTGYQYSQATTDEPASDRTTTREASYGWVRENASQNYGSTKPRTTYSCNIDTDNYDYDVLTYFRNSEYDDYHDSQYQTWVYKDYAKPLSLVSANYYKPIKGLPISNQLAPCPFYIPDDFVMLQLSTQPGLAEFRTGDTITVSGSEIYTIIAGSYNTSSTGLSGVSGDVSIGIVLAARTT